MSKAEKAKILLVLTGGTICSFVGDCGKREADVERALTVVVDNFRNGSSPYRGEEVVDFVPVMPLDILSENMTAEHWNTLAEHMKGYDYSQYDGVIILHGTDTLAYTASLFSILMAGTKIPVIFVSSQLPPDYEGANGNANFRAATELIVNGIKPNVYATYRNCEVCDGKKVETMYIHYGAHLLQCANHSDNFYSCDMTPLEGETAMFEGRSSGKDRMLLHSFERITPCVLRIVPYVGIDYSFFSLEGVKVVLHGTYHSSTACVNPYEKEDNSDSSHSVLWLKKRCDEGERTVPVYLEPCNEVAYEYETTCIALKSGIKALYGTTSEMAYAKLLLGCCMGLEGEELDAFLSKEINGEFIM